MRIHSTFLFLLLAACGGGAETAPPAAAPVATAPVTAVPVAAASAPVTTPAPAPAPEHAAPAPAAPPEHTEEAAAAPPAPAPPPPSEAKGKLLTKPKKGAFQIELASGSPAVGDKGDFYRMVDKSIPFIGGSWVLIAETKVAAVKGKTVTLEILAEKANMKINGRKLDHYTPGVPVILKWPTAH